MNEWASQMVQSKGVGRQAQMPGDSFLANYTEESLADPAVQRAAGMGILRSLDDPDRTDQGISSQDKIMNLVQARSGNYQQELEQEQGRNLWTQIFGIGAMAAGFATMQPWLVALGAGATGFAGRAIDNWNKEYHAETEGMVKRMTEEQAAASRRFSEALTDLRLMVQGREIPLDKQKEYVQLMGKMKNLGPDEMAALQEAMPNLMKGDPMEAVQQQLAELSAGQKGLELSMMQQNMERDKEAERITYEVLARQTYAEARKNGATHDQAVKASRNALYIASNKAGPSVVSKDDLDMIAENAGGSLAQPFSIKEKNNLPPDLQDVTPDAFTPFIMRRMGIVNATDSEAKQVRRTNREVGEMPPFAGIGQRSPLGETATPIAIGDSIRDYVVSTARIGRVDGVKTLVIPIQEKMPTSSFGSTQYMAKGYIPIFNAAVTDDDNVESLLMDAAAVNDDKLFHPEFLKQVEMWAKGATLAIQDDGR